jgi:amphi-Trp domain-containing protein
MSDKNEFEYADKLSAMEVADYLEKIAEGLKTRSLKLQGKGQAISLLPQDTLKLKVSAEAKEGKGSIEFEISWKNEYVVGSQKLEIGSTETA